MFEGRGPTHGERSGLSHEEETVLTYFSEPQTIQSVLQITRYDELDTCKVIAQLLEGGLLEVSRQEVAPPPTPVWQFQPEPPREQAQATGPSRLFWPLVAVFMAVPMLLYVPRGRASINPGLASLQPAHVRTFTDAATQDRLAFALRLAAPADGGLNLAKSLGIDGEGLRTAPDLLASPDPLFEATPMAVPGKLP